MMTGALAYAATVDKGFLRTVQKTASDSDFSQVISIVFWVFVGILLLGGILYLINRFFLHAGDDVEKIELFDIRDPEEIRKVFEEADARKSTMELHVPEYRHEGFKCLLLDFKKAEDKILLEDPPERGPMHNFKNKRVIVDFVINYRDKQKFYSFTTTSEGIIPINMRGFKRAIVLKVPRRIEIKQRRNAVRLEPPLDYEITVNIIKNQPYSGIPLEDIEFSEDIQVEDISRNGMRLIYEKGSFLDSFKKGDIFAIRFFLNPNNLSLGIDLDKYIFMEVEVVHNDLKNMGKRYLGILFLKRGVIKDDRLYFERLKSLTNEDIHKWITALYARQLRRERGLERKQFEYINQAET